VQGDIEKILIDRQRIAARIRELALQIRRDLDGLSRDGEIVLVPILTGSIIFVADLMRELPQKVRINVVAVSSYPGKSTASKGAAIAGALPDGLEDKHVLIVDDILDSGWTMSRLKEEADRAGARSVSIAVLLDKPSRRQAPIRPDFAAFEVPDVWVVGYGLDYNERYRNLPYIAVYAEEGQS